MTSPVTRWRALASASAVGVAAVAVAGVGWAQPAEDAQAPPEPVVFQAGEIVNAGTSLSADAADTRVVSYPGATYIKVHFASLDLAPGDYLTVSSPDGTEVHTYHGAPGDGLIDGDSGYTVHGDSGFAAMSVFGDTAEVTIHSSGDVSTSNLVVDKYWRGYGKGEFNIVNADIMSVCGNDARRDTVCYQDSHPAEYESSRAVARLLSNGSGLCTTWRVGNTNRMLTNNHCVSSQSGIAATESQFGYECATCGGDNPSEGVKVGGDTLIQTNSTHDFTLFSVQNFDSITSFGTLYIANREPVAGERIYIPGHGDAIAKRLSIYEESDGGVTCKIDTPQDSSVTTGYMCDTSGGNSGSPVVLGDSNEVIALHALGGCENSGYRMSLIYPLIAGDIDNSRV
ncbi:trypsin-like serine peptidase [Stackebrandtia soli]|uniref:trypsin-like serine peptidase n=1 Tax=Stackebrandtia soli TaxID=1892856 RepID=UPI0039EB0117